MAVALADAADDEPPNNDQLDCFVAVTVFLVEVDAVTFLEDTDVFSTTLLLLLLTELRLASAVIDDKDDVTLCDAVRISVTDEEDDDDVDVLSICCWSDACCATIAPPDCDIVNNDVSEITLCSAKAAHAFSAAAASNRDDSARMASDSASAAAVAAR